MVDKDELLEKLTEDDIIKLIESLGGNHHRLITDGSETTAMIFPTVCHHGDTDKLYYYLDNKVFRCYTDCGELFNVYGLVMRSLDVTFYESLIYIVNTLGYHSLSSKIGFMGDNKIKDWEIMRKYTSFMDKKTVPVLETYDSSILNIFNDIYYDGWINEGITIATMQKYNIKYSIVNQRIIIPHYNVDGELVGIRGRAMVQEEIDSGMKYMPITIGDIMYSHQTKHNLYGLNVNKKAIKALKKVMLVEGAKSVLQCHSFYGESNFTVAVSGSSVSNHQRDLLLECGISEIIIAFDKEYCDDDEESVERYFKKMLKIAYKFVNYCTVYLIYDKDNLTEFKSAPTDNGRLILEKLMKTKYEIKGDK